MFAKISHKGLNHRKDASKLHQMISEGYKHKFQKEEKPVQPTPEDKQVFIEAILEEENAVLLGGLKYA
jgi:hypothetical protein